MEQTNANEIPLDQKCFTMLWNIRKQYDKIQTDEEWEMYVYQTDEIYKKEFKGTKCEKYFLDMLLATTDRLEKIWKERNSKS